MNFWKAKLNKFNMPIKSQASGTPFEGLTTT